MGQLQCKPCCEQRHGPSDEIQDIGNTLQELPEPEVAVVVDGGPGAGRSDAEAAPEGGESGLVEVESDPKHEAESVASEAGRMAAEIIAEAERLMEETNVLEAEEVLAQALARLADTSCAQRAGESEGAAGQAVDALASAGAIRSSAVFGRVQERVAQWDAGCDMLSATNMQVLYESENGKFELFQGNGSWFDYRMTVNLEAPLCACLATCMELDLIPLIQTNFKKPPQILGPTTNHLLRTLASLDVLICRVELLFEILRIPDRKFGFFAESIRSSFPSDGVEIPPKGSWAVRPWIYTTNVWMPRGGEEKGTVLVQVTRVDCGIKVPQFVLDFVFRQISGSYMADLRKGAAKALDPESPWAKRIQEDKHGLYRELRELETVAEKRRAVNAKTMPGKEVFDRSWRLRPTPHDTRPPSSRVPEAAAVMPPAP